MNEVQSLTALLEKRATAAPDRVALSIWTKGQWVDLSYGELFRKVQALGSVLIDRGVARGDRVMMISYSRPEWAIGFFAILYAGAIAVPVDPRSTDDEVQRILQHCEPVLVLRDLEGHAAGVPLQPPRDRIEDVAVIAYTSGTGGTPKGAMITGASLLYEMQALAKVHRLRRNDVFLSVLPLNHMLELTCGLLAVIYAGGNVLYGGTLLPQELAEKMRTRGVTTMVGVPAMYRMLKKAAEGVPHSRIALRVASVLPSRKLRQLLFPELRARAGSRLRRFISGGSPIEPEVLEFFDRLGVPIYQGYGLTETAPVVSVNGPGANRLGSVGRPLPGTEIRVAESGEILVRGPQLMTGYHKAPGVTAEVIDSDGWLHTGDLGHLDDGFLYITGRLKDLIVLGDGRKVHPDEVEAVLSSSPLLKEVCVVGLPGEGGEQVCAVVVPSEGRSEQEVQSAVRELALKLRDFKRPRRVMVRLTELPRTRTLKVKRDEVRNWVRSQS